MNEVFKPVKQKLDRVKKQISDLEISITDFNTQNLISIECILNEGRLGYKLVQKSIPENAPISEWDILFGECLHNLRTSLDNFAYALARLKQDPPLKPKHICFPIYTNKEEFNRNERKNLEQFPETAAELIEKLQPYNRDGSENKGKPEDDPLVILNELNNLDKHRIPSVALVTPTEIGQEVSVEFENEEDASANVPPDVTIWVGPLKPGEVLLNHKTKHPIKNVKGKYEIKAAVGIQYKERYLYIIPVLKQLHDYIVLVISQFNEVYN